MGKSPLFFQKSGRLSRQMRGLRESTCPGEKAVVRCVFLASASVHKKPHPDMDKCTRGVYDRLIYIIEQRRSDTEAVVQPLKKEPSPLGEREGSKKTKTKKTRTTGFQHGRGRCAAKPTTQAHAIAEGRGAKQRGEGKIVGMPLPDTEKTSETQGVWREKRKFAS